MRTEKDTTAAASNYRLVSVKRIVDVVRFVKRVLRVRDTSFIDLEKKRIEWKNDRL